MRAAAARGDVPPDALFKQAEAFLRAEKNKTERARLASELAFTLAGVLESCRDKAAAKTALDMLLGLGAAGETLAFSHLGKNSESPEDLARTLDMSPAWRQLLLLNRFFAVPRAVDSKVLASAVERVRQTAGQDPDSVLQLLDHLDRHGRSPAYPLQWEFLKGQFGVWLEQLLKLDLDQDQARYMVRTAGLLESSVLASAISSLATKSGVAEATAVRATARSGSVNPEAAEAAVRQGLKHKDAGVRREAMAALISLGSGKASAALAFLINNRPEDRPDLLPLALELSGTDFRDFASFLDDEVRAEFLWELACLAAEGDNEAMGRVAAGFAKSGERAVSQAALAAAKLAARFAEAGPKAAFIPRPYVRNIHKEDDGQGLINKFKRRVEEMAGKEDDAHMGGAQALAGLDPGGSLGRATVRDADLAGIELKNCAFDNTSFSGLGLKHGLMEQCRFKNCRLKAVDLGGAKLDGIIVHGTVFEHCVFSGASLEGTFFSGCTFKGCHFDAAGLGGLQAHNCLFAECDFWGAQFKGASLTSCSFSACSLAYTHVADSVILGVSWRDCIFEHALFERAEARSCSSVAGLWAGCVFHGFTTDDPEFLAAIESAVNEAVAAPRMKHPAPPQGLADPKVVNGLLRVMGGWFFERDARKRLGAALMHNRRRMLWAAGKWGSKAAEFLKLLPLLVESGKAVPGAVAEAPPCRLMGYHPDHAALRLAEQYLGEEAAASHEPGDAIVLEGLYSMGSVGTIAQTRTSDLDLWLCHEPGALDEAALDAVKAKLADIESWAEREFGLEVHFFVMDMQSVRENDFGFSDKESAGSAQAMLLKEEFYRTVIHLAGKKPAWWCVTPGASLDEYKRQIAALQAVPGLGASDLADLGHLEAVPKEEFFGASLWQIVKALKRPFKSVMKFALLDRYFSNGEAGLLFCDAIKARLLKGVRDLWDVDGYGVLFREVHGFYKGRGDLEAMGLMRRAFLQKTRFNLEGRTTGRPGEMTGASFMEYFHPVSESALERDIAPAVGPGTAVEEEAGFEQLASTGRRVSRYIFSTYEKVRRSLDLEDGQAAVTQEDMTKLGRKILANFQHKEGKIMPLPFVAPPRGLYGSLDIQCLGSPGAQTIWIARGRRQASGEEGGTVVDEIARDRHPVGLAAWLLANEIYEPKLAIQAGNLQKPLALSDLTELLAAMNGFFPHEDTFNTDIEENLNDERAVKAFTVVNLMSLREEPAIRDAQMVYATNWGEMFFLPNPGGLHLLESDPLNFVRANVPHVRGYAIQCEFHIPRKARCPRVIVP